MARLLKCYGFCGEKYEKENLINYKSKNYCKECYEIKVKDDEGRKILIDTISAVFNIPYPNGQMLRQMKMFREDRNYQYEDQAKAILYSVKILKKNMHPKYGLGLIPYVIDDAIKFYEERRKLSEQMKGKNFESDSKTFKMKPKKMVDNQSKILNKRLINMEDIL